MIRKKESTASANFELGALKESVKSALEESSEGEAGVFLSGTLWRAGAS